MYVCMPVCVCVLDGLSGSGWMEHSNKLSVGVVFIVWYYIFEGGFLASPASPNGVVVVFSVVVLLLVDWSIVLRVGLFAFELLLQVVLCGVWFSHTLG